MKHYKTGHSFSSKQLFENFYSESLENDLNITGKKTQLIANKVFLKAFTLILDDVIENNKVFKLPTTKEAYIEILKWDKEKFKNARQQGFFKDIDIIKSNFQGATIQFRYRNKYKWSNKRIIIDKKRRSKLINNLYLKKY